MPTPLPSADTADLLPPGAEEVQHLTRGVLAAIAPAGGPTELQRLLVGAAFAAMTGHAPITVDQLPSSPRASPPGWRGATRPSAPGSSRP